MAALQGLKGTSVLVSKDDYGPLLKALGKLDHGACITYKVPDVKVMANALFSKLGHDFGSSNALAEELMRMRNVFEGFKEEMKLGIRRGIFEPLLIDQTCKVLRQVATHCSKV